MEIAIRVRNEKSTRKKGGTTLKIFMSGTSFDWIDQVFIAVLKDEVAIKFSLNDEFVMFVSKSQFRRLVAEAKKREEALTDVTFVLDPERVESSE